MSQPGSELRHCSVGVKNSVIKAPPQHTAWVSADMLSLCGLASSLQPDHAEQCVATMVGSHVPENRAARAFSLLVMLLIVLLIFPFVYSINIQSEKNTKCPRAMTFSASFQNPKRR